MQGLVLSEDIKVSCLCESFVYDGALKDSTSGNTEVSKPARHIHFDLVHNNTDISALTTGSQGVQLLFCFLQRFCISTNEVTFFPLPSEKPRNLTILDCHN